MDKYILFAIPIIFVILMRILVPAPIIDDAFITAQVARNLAEGNGLIHNAGERVFTITTVVWALLNSALIAIGVDAVSALRILSFLSEIALALALTALGFRLFKEPRAGAFSALLLLSCSGFVVSSFGGMEIALSLATIALALMFLVENRSAMALLIAALSIWVRIDNLILLAVVGCFTLFDKTKRPPFKAFIPPALIVLLYFIGAQIYFGTPVPVSVLRKSEFQNPSWTAGAVGIAVQFFKTAVGRAEPMFKNDSIHWFALIPIAFGVFSLRAERARKFAPVLVYTIIYMVLWISTGRIYATIFNWYFLPPMIGIYLLGGFGFTRAVEKIRPEVPRRMVCLSLLILWAGFSLVHSMQTMSAFQNTTHAGREKTYSAITVFLNERLPEGSTICAGEIGAIKFYARPDISVLDWVGLTRPLSDKRAPRNLVEEERPEAIVYWPFPWQNFGQISGLYSEYSWGEINGIMLGVRGDIADEVYGNTYRLVEIFNTININKEKPI